MERPLLLGQDADGEVEPPDQVLEARPEDPAPARADVAELAGQRRRRLAGRHAHQLDERCRPGRRRGGPARERPSRGRAIASRVAGALGEDAVVDQLVERADRRVLVGDPGQEQLLEPVRRRLRVRAGARELLAEPVEQAAGVRAEARLEVGQRGGHRPGLDVRLVAGDQEVADLVEEAERADLAGLDRRRAGRPGRVHPGGQPADARPCR